MHLDFAKLQIPIIMFLGQGDRLLPYDRAFQLNNEIQRINKNVKIITINRTKPKKVIEENGCIKNIILKDANHCLYHPKSSYEFVNAANLFLTQTIKK